jgi:hypothetical protein
MATGADIPKEMYALLENVTLVQPPPVRREVEHFCLRC